MGDGVWEDRAALDGRTTHEHRDSNVCFVHLSFVKAHRELTEVEPVIAGVEDVGVIKNSMLFKSYNHFSNEIINTTECTKARSVNPIALLDLLVSHGLQLTNRRMAVAIHLVVGGQTFSLLTLRGVFVLRSRHEAGVSRGSADHKEERGAVSVHFGRCVVQKLNRAAFENVSEVVGGVVVAILDSLAGTGATAVVLNGVVVISRVAMQTEPLCPARRDIGFLSTETIG